MEQLENAFHTPAKINLCYGFGDSLSAALPPLPTMPIPKVEPIRKQEDLSTQNISVPIDICRLEPTVLPGSDSLAESHLKQIWRRAYLPRAPGCRTGSSRKTSSSAESHHLLKLPQPQWSSRLHCWISYHHLPMLSQSSEIEHDNILNLILTHATEIPSEDRHMWLELDSSSKQGA